MDSLPYPAFVLNVNLRILAANAAARRLFGRDVEGIDVVRVLRQPEALACFEDAKAHEGLVKCNLVIHMTVPRTYQLSAAQIPFGEARVLMVSLLDQSAEIDAEKSRSTFVANVSHELRSPLTTLMGIVETLQGPAREDTNARDKFLTMMGEETQRMSRLVGDLLSLSKLEAKSHKPPQGLVNIVNILKRVEAALAASHERNIGRVQIIAADDIPNVLGDEDELTEVFQNILENALKYSPAESPIRINIKQLASGAPSRRISISIADQGDGIAQEHIPRLTERFYRVDKGRSREIGGTGLGLAIVKHILNRHRGRLSIESTPGEGTTMTVSLPV